MSVAARTAIVARQQGYVHPLDLLRGFAALVICFYHMGFLFTSQFQFFASGYLCVDLFFLLSGYVIAHTYDGKIAAGLSLGAFGVHRLARLYPLFLVTTLVGFVGVLGREHASLNGPDIARAAGTLGSNLLLLPNLLHPFGIRSSFPFNGATWSICFEFYVNVLFFLFWRYLDTRRLALVVLLSAVWLVIAAAQAGTLDLGTKTYDFPAAAPRVLFSFFLGVLMRRGGGWGVMARLSGPVSLGVLAALGLVLSLRSLVPSGFGLVSDLVSVLFVFPAALAVFTTFRFSLLQERVSAFFGNISYSVYLLQTPLIVFFAALPQIFLHEKLAAFIPWAGFAFMATVVGASWLVWRNFEVPAKQFVRRRFAELAAWRARPSRPIPASSELAPTMEDPHDAR